MKRPRHGIFSRSATKTPFGRNLLAINQRWDQYVAAADLEEDANRVVLRSALAGSTVALGAYEHAVLCNFRSHDPVLPAPHLPEPKYDRIVQFAQALEDPSAIEAAYRVVVWGLVAEYAVYFWRPNYEYEIHACEVVFGFRNLYESTPVAFGHPTPAGATEDQKADRLAAVAKACLYGMISAALDEPVEPENSFINMHLPTWTSEFAEGSVVGGERLKQLAPDGIPIWE